MNRIEGAVLAGALMLAGASADAVNIPTDPAELTQEISMRCIYDSGEFGDDAVQACMRADRAAANALMQYPADAEGVVNRCLAALWQRGYSMVQVCVEQDLEATAALAALGPEHAPVIAACREKVGAHGAANVKRCVDAQGELPK